MVGSLITLTQVLRGSPQFLQAGEGIISVLSCGSFVPIRHLPDILPSALSGPSTDSVVKQLARQSIQLRTESTNDEPR